MIRQPGRALQQTASRYDTWARLTKGGFNNINTGGYDNGLGDSFFDFLSQGGQALLAPAQEKLDRLDLAIKALLVMGTVSSLTGIAMFFRRR